MPARKSSKGTTKSRGGAKKGSTKKGSTKTRAAFPSMKPYGAAIRDAMVRGDAAEMRSVASAARKHLADVQKALAQLEKKAGYGGK